MPSPVGMDSYSDAGDTERLWRKAVVEMPKAQRVSARGRNPAEVSIHEPQEHPPPPSGDRSMPRAVMVLSQ